MHVEPSWHELLDQLETKGGQSLFVMGPVDSGKTTLCRFLSQQLAARGPTAFIDCDPGQSRIGPPTTLGLAWAPWNGGAPQILRFVGSKSPVGHFLQALTGIKRLVDYAQGRKACHVVLDAPGYIDTDAGREFFFQAIDLLVPDHLVALQRVDELEPLLRCFTRRERPHVHRLPISDVVVPRSREERRAYRKEKFEQYFGKALPQVLSLKGIGLHGHLPAFDDPESCWHRLVALCDPCGFVVTLGLLRKLDHERQRLHCLAPPFRPGRVATVQFGSLQLDPSGEER